MYVNILTFKINEKDGISSNELSMLDDNIMTKPKGLDRLHVFKDKKKKNKFYLIEYWTSKDFKDQMEKSSNHLFLNRIHQVSVGNQYKNIECDVVI
ncbi:MAG: hypothetical protein J7K34_09380 [Flavobacteriaceae bacterium]|nr:hypothetical protein [Flavobacteriaceae bacterium]